MSSQQIDSHSPAWETIVMQLRNNTLPEPELLRAGFQEHLREKRQQLDAEIAEAIELREEWIENAELLHPSNAISFDHQLDEALENQVSVSKPSTPKVPLLARIPFLRRFIK